MGYEAVQCSAVLYFCDYAESADVYFFNVMFAVMMLNYCSLTVKLLI